MQDNVFDRWRLTMRGAWPAFLIGLFCLLLTCLLSRGTSGGDEGGAIMFAAEAKAMGWQAMLMLPGGAIRAHRLFWSAEKYVLDAFYSLVLPADFYGRANVRSALLTMDGCLFMLASLVAGWRLLVCKGHDRQAALLAPACVLLASSAISLFAGGVIECMMCLFVVILMSGFEERGRISRGKFATLLLGGVGLIFCKEYSLAVLLPLALLIQDRAQRLWYLALMLAAGLILVGIARIGTHSNSLIGLYLSQVSADGTKALIGRVIGQYVSFAFGLLWCFPFLGLAALEWRKNRRALAVKVAALLLLSLCFALFSYVYGPGAVAGPRYIVPFLLILLPEVADGIAVLRRRRPAMLLAIPLAALFFLPAIDYRNSLISRWIWIRNDSIIWSDTDPLMHPAVFAWRVVVAQHRADVTLRPSRAMPYIVPVDAIFPMTGISRVIYALDHRTAPPDVRLEAATGGASPDARLPGANAWLTRHNLDNPLPWRIARWLMAMLFLGCLLLVALGRPATIFSAGKVARS